MAFRRVMNQHFSFGWVIVTLAILAYFFIGVVLVEEAVLFVGGLLLVLVGWFLVYKLRYKNVGNRGLVARMYADLKAAVEEMKESVAEEKEPRRVARARKSQYLTQREERRTVRAEEAPSADENKYAEMIERRVREAKANRERSQGEDESEY